MVESAVLHYDLRATGSQIFFVSDTLIEELLALDAVVQEEPNSSISVHDRIPKSLVELAHKCKNSRTGSNDGLAHLLLGYKDDVNKETVWLLYAYYLRCRHTLIFFPSNERCNDGRFHYKKVLGRYT